MYITAVSLCDMFDMNTQQTGPKVVKYIEKKENYKYPMWMIT